LTCSHLNKNKKTYLAGGFNPSEKYEFVNGKDYPIYYYWKNNKKKFETTNQCLLVYKPL